jgi:2-methylcitrate dehydratase PrpD
MCRPTDLEAAIYFDDDFTAKEQGVSELMPKITVSEDKVMTRTFPYGAPCKITVTLRAGSVIEGSRDYPHGDPRDPLSDQEIESKALAHLAHLADQKKARTIINRVWNLENEPSIDWLVDPLKQRVLQES